jgi:hypothetical protein
MGPKEVLDSLGVCVVMLYNISPFGQRVLAGQRPLKVSSEYFGLVCEHC